MAVGHKHQYVFSPPLFPLVECTHDENWAPGETRHRCTWTSHPDPVRLVTFINSALTQYVSASPYSRGVWWAMGEGMETVQAQGSACEIVDPSWQTGLARGYQVCPHPTPNSYLQPHQPFMRAQGGVKAPLSARGNPSKGPCRRATGLTARDGRGRGPSPTSRHALTSLLTW